MPIKPYQGLPRTFDFVFAAICLLLCLPLLLGAAALIKWESKGPLLFCQRRVGRNGRLFTLYKLRTMHVVLVGPAITAANDLRITRSGRFLRRSKIDELPQLWNVILGDMALVGPRPEVPEYVDANDVCWQKILSIRPGITDALSLLVFQEEKILAENGPNPERFYREKLLPFKMNCHLQYLRHRTWKTDLVVLLNTFLRLLGVRRNRNVVEELRHGDI